LPSSPHWVPMITVAFKRIPLRGLCRISNINPLRLFPIMSKFFHKLDKQSQQYLLYHRKANGVVLLVAGVLWAMEISGYFNAMPLHPYFMPGFLAVAGLFEIARAFRISTSK